MPFLGVVTPVTPDPGVLTPVTPEPTGKDQGVTPCGLGAASCATLVGLMATAGCTMAV